MTRKRTDDEPEEAAQEVAEEPMVAEAPIDRNTGKPYKSGEVPPGWNEPVP